MTTAHCITIEFSFGQQLQLSSNANRPLCYVLILCGVLKLLCFKNRAKALLLQRGNHNISTKNAPYEQYGRPKGLVDSGSNTHQYSEYRGPNLDMKAFPLLSSLFTFEHSRIVLLPQSRWGVNWQCCGSRQVSCPANALWGTQTSAWNSAWFMFGIHKKEQSFSCEKWSLRDIERSKKILLGPSWQTLGALQLLRPLSLLQRQGVVAGPACRRSQHFQEGIALDSPGHFVGLFDWLFRYVHHVRPFRSAWQTLFWLAQHSAYTSFIKLVALKERSASRKISACLPWSFARNSGCTLYFANRRRSEALENLLKLSEAPAVSCSVFLLASGCFSRVTRCRAQHHLANRSAARQQALLSPVGCCLSAVSAVGHTVSVLYQCSY